MSLYPELTRGPIVYTRVEHLRHMGVELRIYVEVEELEQPVLRGASMRTHRVWQNGRLASGGAWRHRLEDAIDQANYLVTTTYAGQLSMLNQRVSKLEVINAQLRAELEALKEKRNTELG